MPPVTRRAWKVLRRSRGFSNCCSLSAQGENDLQLCITNYFKRNKMKPSKGKYPKRNSFTSEHEFAFAEHLVHMHRNEEISSHNIGSHIVPEVTNMLLQRFGISFPSNSIRSKYYALQSLTRLYISFKKRGTDMGWDSTNYTFMMDDERWSHLVQVNQAYARFYNSSCLLYHVLEEVFMNWGATGDFSAGYVESPPNSTGKQQMENAARRYSSKGLWTWIPLRKKHPRNL